MTKDVVGGCGGIGLWWWSSTCDYFNIFWNYWDLDTILISAIVWCCIDDSLDCRIVGAGCILLYYSIVGISSRGKWCESRVIIKLCCCSDCCLLQLYFCFTYPMLKSRSVVIENSGYWIIKIWSVKGVDWLTLVVDLVHFRK